MIDQNIKDNLKIIFITQGKFTGEVFNDIIKLANPILKPLLQKLWTQIIIIRYSNILLMIIHLVISGVLLVSIKTHNYELFILCLLLSILTHSITMILANHVQDKMFLLHPAISESIEYFTRNSIAGRKFNSLSETFINKIRQKYIMERFSYMGLNFVFSIIIYSYIFEKYWNISPIYTVLFYIFVIIGVSTIFLSMNHIYRLWFKRESENQIVIQNITSQGIFSWSKKFNLDLGIGKKYAISMSVIKALANVYPSIFLLLLLLYPWNDWVIIMIIFKMIIGLIDSYFYEPISKLPDIIYFDKHIFNPIIQSLRTVIPTPLSVKGSISKINSIEKLLLRNVTYLGDNQKLLLNTGELSIPITHGIYTIIGDSGEGKSLFLNAIGNNLKPDGGDIFLMQKGKINNYSDFDYWSLKKKISYVWVTNSNFKGTTAIKMFKCRLDKDLRASYLDKFIDMPPTLLINDFIYDSVSEPRFTEEHQIHHIVSKMLDKLLFESGLFREDEDHILNTDISNLSGGQKSRLINAFYLSGPEQVVMLDESLERTTHSFKNGKLYTRERLINFISYIAHISDKTIFLLLQGGLSEYEKALSLFSEDYLGNIEVEGGIPKLDLAKDWRA